jgi:hypothetical protein
MDIYQSKLDELSRAVKPSFEYDGIIYSGDYNHTIRVFCIQLSQPENHPNTPTDFKEWLKKRSESNPIVTIL